MHPHPPAPLVIPVIHRVDTVQAVSEARRAFEAGARGVFLIDHGGGPALTRAAATVETGEEVWLALRAAGIDRPWVGLNLLGLAPEEAFAFLHQERAIWAAGVWCDGEPDQIVKHATGDGVWAARYFAGVAFKYQRASVDLAAEARRALAHGADVLTTSGPGTGQACDPEKVRRLCAAAGPLAPVAVASGVSAENAGALIEAGARHLLVASSIAEGTQAGPDFHRMDAGKLRYLLAVAAETAAWTAPDDRADGAPAR